MKSVIIFIVFISFFSDSLAQDDSNSVGIVAYWNEGDSYKFKVTKITKTWKEDKLARNDSITYTAEFMVADATEDSYSIMWECNIDFVSSSNLPENLRDLFAGYEDLSVNYTTSELGEYKGIKNWVEISDQLRKMLNVWIQSLEMNSEERVVAERSIETVMNIW
jgi:hypothetical protein